jgi:hypothetical protein
VEGLGHFFPQPVDTDEQGVATTWWTLGQSLDTHVARAFSAGLAVDFTVETRFVPSGDVTYDLKRMTRLNNGVYVRTVTEGWGGGVTKGRRAQVSSITSLTDGREVADDRFEFELGSGRVIPGFDAGVLGMKPDEQRIILVPPNQGFGASPRGSVPPWSILIFHVRLLPAGCDFDTPYCFTHLMGRYETVAFRYTALANPDLAVDLADLGFGIRTLVVGPTGAISGVVTLASGAHAVSMQYDGRLTDIGADSLTMNFVFGQAGAGLPSPLAASYQVTPESLHLRVSPIHFDFSALNGPPGPTACTLEMVLRRVDG